MGAGDCNGQKTAFSRTNRSFAAHYASPASPWQSSTFGEVYSPAPPLHVQSTTTMNDDPIIAPPTPASRSIRIRLTEWKRPDQSHQGLGHERNTWIGYKITTVGRVPSDRLPSAAHQAAKRLRSRSVAPTATPHTRTARPKMSSHKKIVQI